MRRSMRRPMVFIVALVSVLALLAGCGGSQPAAQPAPAKPAAPAPAATPAAPAQAAPAKPAAPATPPKPEKPNLTIGMSTTGMGFSPVYMAIEKGYFQQEGLTVKANTFKGGPELVQATVSGSIDLAVGGATEALDGLLAGQKMFNFMGVANHSAYEWWATAKFKTVKDLAAAKGKVAVSRIGAASHQISRWAFKRAGFDPDKDFQYIQFSGGGAGRLAAMKAGQVDAIPATPPGGYDLKQSGFSQLLKLSDVLPEYAWEVAYAKEDFMKKNPETVKAFARALVRGMQLIKKSPEEATDIAMKHMGSKPTVKPAMLETFKQIANTFPEDGRHPEESYKMFIQFYQESGDIKGTPPDLKAFLDYSVIDYLKKNPVK